MHNVRALPHGLEFSFTCFVVGLVIGEDEVPFVESSRVNMFVITSFGAVFGSFDVLESGTTIFIGLFEI